MKLSLPAPAGDAVLLLDLDFEDDALLSWPSTLVGGVERVDVLRLLCDDEAPPADDDAADTPLSCRERERDPPVDCSLLRDLGGD